MKSFLKKFFLWIRDHFTLLLKFIFRLEIGVKKENPLNELGSNPVDDSIDETEKGETL